MPNIIAACKKCGVVLAAANAELADIDVLGRIVSQAVDNDCVVDFSEDWPDYVELTCDCPTEDD